MGPVFFLVGDTARNPAQSGIQTVVRSLAGAFGRLHSPVRLALWNARLSVVRPLPPELSVGADADILRDEPHCWPRELNAQPLAWVPWLLSGLRGKFVPIHRHPQYRNAAAGTWLLLPELMYKERAKLLVDYAHRHGRRVAVILYDTIPVDHPEHVPAALPLQHAGYLRALAKADLILPISETSAEDWRQFCAREDLTSPPVRVCTLACDLVGTPRVTAVDDRPPITGAPIRLLCVSTLEPRKNHRTLLEAYAIARSARPDLDLRLDLVGAAYAGMEDVAQFVREASQRLPGLQWHGQVGYEELRMLYAGCDFTVYPSLVEGFGLPVIESLWFGRPCLCANFGVMAENAAGGGCLTADVTNAADLAATILRLASGQELRHRLASEAVNRSLKTWQDYAMEILHVLETHGNAPVPA